MSRVFWALSLLVLLGSASACRTGREAVAPQSDEARLRVGDFFPLAVGHAWTYEVRGGGQRGEQTVTIMREDGGWFVDSMGGRLRMDAFGLRDPDRYLLRSPLVVGASWSNVESVQSVERHEVIEAGVSCATAAGTWARCVTVRTTNAVDKGRVFVLESTYAEGIGLVAQRTLQEARGHDPVVVLERELLSFDLAQ